jgi:hypothetical protein
MGGLIPVTTRKCNSNASPENTLGERFLAVDGWAGWVKAKYKMDHHPSQPVRGTVKRM